MAFCMFCCHYNLFNLQAVCKILCFNSVWPFKSTSQHYYCSFIRISSGAMAPLVRAGGRAADVEFPQTPVWRHETTPDRLQRYMKNETVGRSWTASRCRWRIGAAYSSICDLHLMLFLFFFLFFSSVNTSLSRRCRKVPNAAQQRFSDCVHRLLSLTCELKAE